jgi:hypothetical protein
MTAEVLLTALKAIGIPVLRNVGGWFNKAFEDGKLEAYEIKEGFHTLFRIGILQTLIYFAVPLSGADPNLLASSAAAALIDWGLGTWKKLNKGKKTKK